MLLQGEDDHCHSHSVAERVPAPQRLPDIEWLEDFLRSNQAEAARLLRHPALTRFLWERVKESEAHLRHADIQDL